MDVLTSLNYIKPELVLIGGSILVLFLDLARLPQRILGCCSLAVLIVSAAYLQKPQETTWVFYNLYLVDGFSYFFKITTLMIVGISILASIDSNLIPETQKGEFYVLMLILGFLLIMMGSVTNLLMIFLAIESVSLTSYILTGFQKFNKRSSEASLKYLLFGAVSSAVMLFGMSILFGLTGTLELSQMAVILQSQQAANMNLALAALMFMLVGLCFKISAAPFHMWAPDVYEGAPTPVAAFLTVAPKSLGFLVLLRVLLTAFPASYSNWSGLLVTISILTMTIGNVVAVSQGNVKRLLAYSSIAQAGYMLMGLATANQIGIQAILIYIVAYIFTNLGAFLTVAIVEQSENSSRIEAFYGLGERSPGLALMLTIFLLSLAGIPPLAGFVGKWFVFASAIQKGFISLAVAAALNSAVAGYYYFRIVKAMYLTPSEKSSPVTRSNFALISIAVALAGTLVIGLNPTPFISFVQSASSLIQAIPN